MLKSPWGMHPRIWIYTNKDFTFKQGQSRVDRWASHYMRFTEQLSSTSIASLEQGLQFRFETELSFYPLDSNK